jgi:MFS family permease
MTASAVGQGRAAGPEGASSTVHVIGASALGTVFEWYDFFLYGSLASDIAAHFFSGVSAATGFIFALATFAVGFIVRPIGALLFGRIGDLAGRKNTFLVTLALMGISTFLVGVLPGYDAIGMAAPLALVALRLVRGSPSAASTAAPSSSSRSTRRRSGAACSRAGYLQPRWRGSSCRSP